MNPEYSNSYDYSAPSIESEFFLSKGISIRQAVLIEEAKQNGLISKEEGYSIASLIDQGIL